MGPLAVTAGPGVLKYGPLFLLRRGLDPSIGHPHYVILQDLDFRFKPPTVSMA